MVNFSDFLYVPSCNCAAPPPCNCAPYLIVQFIWHARLIWCGDFTFNACVWSLCVRISCYFIKTESKANRK